MASIAQPAADARTPVSVWVGRVLTGLVAAFLLADSGMKLAVPEMMAANTPPNMGWPLDSGTLRMLGVLLIVTTLLYLWPRTALLGAILITGYLGGAIATHARIGDPLFSHTLFGLYLALMGWGGLWLRSPALRNLLPFVQAKD